MPTDGRPGYGGAAGGCIREKLTWETASAVIRLSRVDGPKPMLVIFAKVQASNIKPPHLFTQHAGGKAMGAENETENTPQAVQATNLKQPVISLPH